ncbi:MAG: phage antirepressor N-terminal domain-containing protein [Rikenellaceae bacterium]
MQNKSLAIINGVSINIIEDGTEEFVPIKPICDVLGVNYSTQLEKIKNHPILKSTIPLRGTVGADGKQREMVCLPLRYIFGWLFTINPNNVTGEARQTVIAYHEKCYNALYDYFDKSRRFVEFKQKLVNEQLDNVRTLKRGFRQSRSNLYSAEANLDQIRNITYEEYIVMSASDIDNLIYKPLAKEVE